MGRKKIQISRIPDERNRQVTFNKRKFGVMKKAYELSVLCDCEIALIIFSSSNKLYQYASTDMDKVLLKYTEYNEPHESLTNKNIIETLNKKDLKGGAMSPESLDESCEAVQGSYPGITPRTEAKYSKMDEVFQLSMQSQHMVARGNNVGASYPLPAIMSVTNMYNETGNLPLQHNASPRPPSSSDADSVYPPGGILESNGYQTSASPALVNSPSSPGQLVMSPSPTPKALNASSRATPPPRHHSPRPTLRLSLPNAPSHHEDNNANSMNTSTASLNTPVVSLQTPVGLSNSYHGMFTDLTSNDMAFSNWSNQLAHNTGMSHLTVSNSSPPSSPSPNSVRIKSEPNSPPHLNHQTSSANSGSASNTVSHSISHLSLPHAHTQNHFSVSGGQMISNQSLVDSRHDFEGGPPPKRSRNTWPT